MQFIYKAKKGPKDIVEGKLDADNPQAAVQKVMQLGLTPLDVHPAKDRPKSILSKSIQSPFQFRSKVSGTDVIVFTRQLADLVDAGVPIMRSLKLILDQTKNPNMHTLVDDMQTAVRDGSTLSDALGRHKQAFPALYVSMVRSGELSGNLDGVLKRLTELLERDSEITSQVKSSLAYPGFVMGIGILTIVVMMTFVIPKITVIYDDMDQTLPVPTIILMNMSNIFVNYWWAMLLGLGGAHYLF